MFNKMRGVKQEERARAEAVKRHAELVAQAFETAEAAAAMGAHGPAEVDPEILAAIESRTMRAANTHARLELALAAIGDHAVVRGAAASRWLLLLTLCDACVLRVCDRRAASPRARWSHHRCFRLLAPPACSPPRAAGRRRDSAAGAVPAGLGAGVGPQRIQLSRRGAPATCASLLARRCQLAPSHVPGVL